MLPHLPAQVLAPDLDRRPGRPHERSPHGRIEREVVVARARKTVTGVLSAPPIDERSRPAAEPRPFQPVGTPAVVEDEGRVDAQALDGRGAVRGRIRVDR